MLQDRDAEIVSRDKTLPGLAALLDRHLLLEKLRELPQFASLEVLTTEYLRYKPANSCVACLRLQFADGSGNYLFAKALTAERFRVSWQHPKRQALVTGQHPQAPVALAESAIILTYPQHDRGLPNLWLLSDSSRRDALFHRWLPGLSASADITLKILRYKPERRLLALLSSDGQPRAVLRFASASRYEAMLEGNKLGNATGEIRLLSAPCDYRLLITEWIEGETLCPEQGGHLPEGAAFAIGQQLADLHLREQSHSSETRVHDDIGDVWRVLNTLRMVAPHQEALFSSLLSTLSERMRDDTFHPVIIHGDFSVDQIVRRKTDGRLQLIDWDRSRPGNPAADLASFQARLELQVIEQTLSPEVVRQILAAFHQGYRQQQGVISPHLNDHVALALLQLAVEPFRKRSTGWHGQIVALIRRAQQLMLSVDQPVQPLLDRAKMAGVLQNALGLSAGAKLLAVEALSYKPGRRAVLEYHWYDPAAEHAFSVVAKYRHKGYQPHGFRVQQALWLDGFDHTATVAVPQPRAVMADFSLWLQQKIAGKRMTELLSSGGPDMEHLGYLSGKALATIQQSRVALQAVSATRWTMNDELRVLRQRLRTTAEQRPEWAERILAVARGCEQLAQLMIPSAEGFIHRDFYPAQLLLADRPTDQIVVIDFDLSTYGPLALDVGNYLAHVQEQALRETGDENALLQHQQAFISGWQEVSGRPEGQNIAIHTTLALARLIAISLLFPERLNSTGRLLTLCEKKLRRLLRDREQVK
ncbi:phosphotransferase family protein [Erwinia mallotivora]|uniref:Aminoglycoside phosphotransferase domain-containing protein n=1 Tax=Erwinia mallotivora TaxID=69222 RepID=A0A014N4M4_9GAMM|nr:aminoglycoside phosphotransferase family protein [Erwinia mallotivora]EXU74358.1 hypothetical protein BG55_18065 [Erwinia mallotivora]